jgi:hypothetical protein
MINHGKLPGGLNDTFLSKNANVQVSDFVSEMGQLVSLFCGSSLSSSIKSYAMAVGIIIALKYAQGRSITS